MARSMRGTRTYGGSGTSHSTTSSYGVSQRYTTLKFFPQGGKFEALGDIEEYLSGDKIQCFECGHDYKSLNKHLVRHQLSADSYRDKYGIPHRYPLVISTVLKKNSETMKMVNEALGDKLIEIREVARSKKRRQRRVDKLTMQIWVDGGKKNKGQRREFSEVATTCVKCDAPITAAANAVTRTSCDGCRRESELYSYRKYSAKKQRARDKA